jgi:hypothetical protein
MSKYSERFLQDLFQETYGIKLLKIKESDNKSPDFEFIDNGKWIFMCELKTIERVRTKQAGWKIINTNSDGIQERTSEKDPTNRISRLIYSAYKQLQSYEEPKVIVFLNKEPLIDVRDLDDTFIGYRFLFKSFGSIINQSFKRVSNGNIKTIKYKIDLYIWIHKNFNGITPFFRYPTAGGYDLSKKYFHNPD